MRQLKLLMHNKQTGAALVTSLIMLMIMTLISVPSIETTIIEEKMAGNMQEEDLAFQAAESALRDAEQYLIENVNGISTFDEICTGGLCYTTDSSGGLWGFDRPDLDADVNAQAIAYTAESLSGIPDKNQPRYLIEGKKILPAGSSTWKYIYRITAIGYGQSSDSKVVLEEVYAI